MVLKLSHLIALYLPLTLWESEEAIRAFAGDDITRARHDTEDAAFLLEMEPTVTHYEIVTAVA